MQDLHPFGDKGPVAGSVRARPKGCKDGALLNPLFQTGNMTHQKDLPTF